jgi:hypothetical protein
VPDDQVGLRAEGVEHTSQLDGDISGSNDDDSLGLTVDVKEAIRVDTVFGTGDLIVGGDCGSPSDGNGDLLRFDFVGRAVVRLNLEGVGIEEGSVALVVVDLVVDQVLLAELESARVLALDTPKVLTRYRSTSRYTYLACA